MLQESTHPAGLPPELRAPAVIDAIAGVVANDVSTFDGRPYQRVVFGARCDEPPVRCELTMDGVPAFAGDPETKDSYTWTVTPAAPLVTMTDHSLRGFPPDRVPELDALARSLDASGRFRDRPLLGVEWELPPPDDVWVLRYGNGLGEGDPTFLVTLDRTNQRIVSIRVLP